MFIFDETGWRRLLITARALVGIHESMHLEQHEYGLDSSQCVMRLQYMFDHMSEILLSDINSARSAPRKHHLAIATWFTSADEQFAQAATGVDTHWATRAEDLRKEEDEWVPWAPRISDYYSNLPHYVVWALCKAHHAIPGTDNDLHQMCEGLEEVWGSCDEANDAVCQQYYDERDAWVAMRWLRSLPIARRSSVPIGCVPGYDIKRQGLGSNDPLAPSGCLAIELSGIVTRGPHVRAFRGLWKHG